MAEEKHKKARRGRMGQALKPCPIGQLLDTSSATPKTQLELLSVLASIHACSRSYGTVRNDSLSLA